MQELQLELAPGSGHTTRLADGLAVTSGGGVAALAFDGTSAWYVQLPDSQIYSSCAIDGDATSVLIGCPSQLQLRDRDGALLSIWDALESTTESYEWRDVALGTRVYAAIADSDVQLSGRVHGVALE